MEKAAGVERSNSDGRGSAVPHEADRERTTVAARVQRWLDNAARNDNTSSGRVPPEWRDVERHLERIFRPAASIITDEKPGRLLSRQLLSAQQPNSGPTPLGSPPQWEDLATSRLDQNYAVRDAYNRPRDWLRAEIVVRVDGAGHLVDATVAVPSGRRTFDNAALEAVRRAVENGSTPAGGELVEVHWAVEGAVAVTLPAVGVDAYPTTGSPTTPMLGLQGLFDRSALPSLQVRTRITLLSIHRPH
jgi:TonB family protein